MRAVAHVSAVVALCAVILWQCGYFVVGATSDLQGSGFGFLSMNLLSPITPMGSSLFSTGAFAQATLGQYEGYAYRGRGCCCSRVWPFCGSRLPCHG